MRHASVLVFDSWHAFSIKFVQMVRPLFWNFLQSCFSGWFSQWQSSTFYLHVGTLMCTGDILAQVFIEKRVTSGNYDFYRNGRFFLYGAFVVGPSLRTWYGILDKVVTSKKKWAPLLKMVLDQVTAFLSVWFIITCLIRCRHVLLHLQSVFAPIFGGVFLYTITLWGSRSFETAKLKLEQVNWFLVICFYCVERNDSTPVESSWLLQAVLSFPYNASSVLSETFFEHPLINLVSFPGLFHSPQKQLQGKHVNQFDHPAWLPCWW